MSRVEAVRALNEIRDRLEAGKIKDYNTARDTDKPGLQRIWQGVYSPNDGVEVNCSIHGPSSGSVIVFETRDRETGEARERRLGPYCFDCLADALDHYLSPAKIKD